MRLGAPRCRQPISMSIMRGDACRGTRPGGRTQCGQTSRVTGSSPVYLSTFGLLERYGDQAKELGRKLLEASERGEDEIVDWEPDADSGNSRTPVPRSADHRSGKSRTPRRSMPVDAFADSFDSPVLVNRPPCSSPTPHQRQSISEVAGRTVCVLWGTGARRGHVLVGITASPSLSLRCERSSPCEFLIAGLPDSRWMAVGRSWRKDSGE